MATERIEETILRNLLFNEEYYRKVVPFLKADYFNEYHERIIFEEIADFASKYDKVPTQEVLSINLQSRNDLTEDTFQSSLSTLKSLGNDWIDYGWSLMPQKSGVKTEQSISLSCYPSRSQMEVIKNYQKMRSQVSFRRPGSIV
jgi:radical SAM superfamily enzyme